MFCIFRQESLKFPTILDEVNNKDIEKVIDIDEEDSEARDLTLARRRFEPETVCREYRARRRAVAGDRKIMMEQWWWCYYSII